jgi:hypothetical protein
MFSAGKVIIGLIIFLGLFSFPLWYNGATGKATEIPDLVYPANETQCVAGKEYMKSNHMDLLNRWRDDVVRRDQRVFVTEDGRKFVMSLQNTCMDCHANKAQFCDRCHNYMAVSPYCWDCHVQPEENEL